MSAKVVVLWLVAGALCVQGSHKIITDVTLGFGQALEHCREEVGTRAKTDMNLFETVF